MKDIRSALSFKGVLENLLFVTYSVPAEKLRAMVPKPLELQAYVDDSGRHMGLVTSTCSYNRGFHWPHSPIPPINFFGSAHRTYVVYGDLPGAYFFETQVDSWAPYFIQKPLCRGTTRARFDYPDRPYFSFRNIHGRMTTSRRESYFSLDPVTDPACVAPFDSISGLVEFIANRPYGYFMSAGGIVMAQSVKRSHWEDPRFYKMNFCHWQPWEDMGFLTRDEMQQPLSSFLIPQMEFQTLPPLPLRTLSEEFWIYAQPV